MDDHTIEDHTADDHAEHRAVMLYDSDFYTWTLEQAARLKDGLFERDQAEADAWPDSFRQETI